MTNFPLHIISMDTTLISDDLGTEFKMWRHQRPVLISAQTGAGKNHFIMHQLIPYALRTNQHVFLFTNRAALNVQQKRDLLRMVSYPDIFTNEQLEHMTSFGPVSIVNYQSALGFLHQFGYSSPIGTNSMVGPLSRGFAIFDEAHFFLSDSLFNASTYQILNRLIYAFSGYVRIYLTATPEDVLPVINELEMRNETSMYLTPYDFQDKDRPSEERALYVYEFLRNYSDYNVLFFTDIHWLYDKLGKATQTDKWLCFINDKFQQIQITKELKQTAQASVACFDRGKKSDEKTWSALIQGKFPQGKNVLFTTIALDNGINITDPNLHNIVVDCTDKVSLLQMIGRKRRSPGERVNLYIKAPSPEFCRNRLLSTREKINFLNEFEQNPTGFLARNWGKFHQEYRNLFYIDNQYNLVPNYLARPELLILESFYAKLLFEMQNAPTPLSANDIYPKMVLKWLSLPQDIQWVGQDKINRAVQGIHILLRDHCENGVPQEEHNDFFKKFSNYADIILNGSETIKKDPRSGPSIMNKFLDAQKELFGTRYEIIKNQGVWQIQQKSLTASTPKYTFVL